MSYLNMVIEQGFTTDSERDEAVRMLATWEDQLTQGQPITATEDELAMVRHVIQYPRSE